MCFCASMFFCVMDEYMYAWASEGLRGDHVSQNAEDVLIGGLLDALINVALGVDLTRVLDG